MTDPKTNAKSFELDDLVPTFESKEVNPNKMEPERYELLVAGMKAHGFLQPILVEKVGEQYLIRDGHHRWWAAREAGLTHVLAVVAELGDKAMGIALAMNRLRGDLDLSATAELIKELVIETDWTTAQMSVNTGFTQGEIESLLERTAASVPNLGDLPSTDPDAPVEKPFVLEVSFLDKSTYTLVKRKLKKAAGKGNDLSVGLLNVLGELDK